MNDHDPATGCGLMLAAASGAIVAFGIMVLWLVLR